MWSALEGRSSLAITTEPTNSVVVARIAIIEVFIVFSNLLVSQIRVPFDLGRVWISVVSGP